MRFLGLLGGVLFCLWLLLLVSKSLSFSKETLLTILLLLWICVLQILWYPIVSARVDQSIVLSTLGSTFAAPWILWMGGSGFAYIILYRKRLFTTAVAIVYLSLTAIVILGVLRGVSLYGSPVMAVWNPAVGEVFNHITLSDSIALIGLFALGLMGTGRNTIIKVILLYGLTLFILVFSYSRLALYGFTAVGLFLIGLRAKDTRWRIITRGEIVFIILLLIGIGFLLTTHFSHQSWIALERMVGIWTGNDPSLQGRSYLLEKGLIMLQRNWLLGQFMIEVIEIGRGSYIHNWLSFWLAYGIGPFLLSTWLIAILLIKSWHSRERNEHGILAFCVLAYCVLCITLGRSYIWPYIWFGVGLTDSILLFSSKKLPK